MSIEIMNRVWNQSQQQGTKLVLLLALADMANTSGYCWPSLETLQKRARLSRYQNVIKAISEMEADAEVWVERSRGRNHSNTYIVTVGMNADDLAKTLITHFDYLPADAMQKASDFLKRSPQTTLSKRSPQGNNVVPEIHLEKENVVPEIQNVVVEVKKRSPQTTRSVIEPSIETKTKTTIVAGGAIACEKPAGWDEVVSAYESNIGMFTAMTSDMVTESINDYGSVQVVDAIKEAVKNNVRKWSYVEGILKRWKANGKTAKTITPQAQDEWLLVNNQYEGTKYWQNAKSGEKRPYVNA